MALLLSKLDSAHTYTGTLDAKRITTKYDIKAWLLGVPRLE